MATTGTGRGRGARTRRPRVAPVGALALAAVTLAGLAGAAPASAAPTTFTWSGHAAAKNSAKDGWSVAGNWKGGAAPAASSTVGVVFPALTCAECLSDENVTGLTLSKVTFHETTAASGSASENLEVSGDAAKLGGLTVTTAVPSGDFYAPIVSFDLPLTVPEAETWDLSLADDFNFEFGDLTGTKAVTASLSVPTGAGGGYLGLGTSTQLGALTFTGTGGAVNGDTVAVTPYDGSASVNGTSKNPVTFDDVGLFTDGDVTYGPLTVTGGQAQLGDGGGTGPYGITAVEGAATFDSSSSLSLWSLEPGTGSAPVAGTDYPQLDATGKVTLGSAALNLYTGCNQKHGTVYTFVKATGGVSGKFAGIANGAVIRGQADFEPSCSGGSAKAPYLKIEYKKTSVTATVVAAPSLPRAVSPGVRLPVSAVRGGRVVALTR